MKSRKTATSAGATNCYTDIVNVVTRILSGLRSWQQGAAAIVAFGGLIFAALFNARLNRKRDERLRQEEVRSVAAALYAEMCVLRSRAGKIAKNVAAVHIARGTTRTTLKVDKHFVRANTLPEQPLYKALASKFGLLPPSLIIPITDFYENINLIDTWLPQIADDPDRGFTYSLLTCSHRRSTPWMKSCPP